MFQLPGIPSFLRLVFQEENRSKARIGIRTGAHRGLLGPRLSFVDCSVKASRIKTLAGIRKSWPNCGMISRGRSFDQMWTHAHPPSIVFDAAWRKDRLLADCLLIASSFLCWINNLRIFVRFAILQFVFVKRSKARIGTRASARYGLLAPSFSAGSDAPAF